MEEFPRICRQKQVSAPARRLSQAGMMKTTSEVGNNFRNFSNTMLSQVVTKSSQEFQKKACLMAVKMEP